MKTLATNSPSAPDVAQASSLGEFVCSHAGSLGHIVLLAALLLSPVAAQDKEPNPAQPPPKEEKQVDVWDDGNPIGQDGKIKKGKDGKPLLEGQFPDFPGGEEFLDDGFDQLVEDLGGRIEIVPPNLLQVDPAMPMDGRLNRFQPGNAQLERAALKTDSDSQVLLESADQLSKQGRFDLASELWQKVIDQSHDLLFTKPEWADRSLTTQFHTNDYQTFLSVVADMEGTLAKLPKEGLENYRLKADGQAKALLRKVKTQEERETALAEIVRRYFLSSIGDEAAFELACLKFERHEFLPATRLFSKVLKEFPDPTVPREQVEIRLAGALARVGGLPQARQLVAQLKARTDGPIPASVLDLVAADIERAGGVDASAAMAVAREALIAPGSTNPSPGGLLIPQSWRPAWTQNFQLRLPEDWPAIPQSPKTPYQNLGETPSSTIVIQGRGGLVDEKQQQRDPVRLWKAGWSPVGQVILSKGLAYFKVEDRLVCVHADSGQVEWLGYRNAYPMDEATKRSMSMYAYQTPEALQPRLPEDYLVQADFVNQSMCLLGDVIYCLQGEALDFQEDPREEPNDRPNGRPFFGGLNENVSRARANRLVAYHSRSGKLLWSLEAEGLSSASQAAMVSFSGPPSPYGAALLIPVHEDRSLCLYALNRATGALLWRTFLCEESPNSASGMSPVAVAIGGGDAYVASGAGIVFAVDAISGTVTWATTYPRPFRRELLVRQANSYYYGNQANWLDGWRFDQLAVVDDVLILAPSDFNHLLALDRRTGRLAWDTAKVPSVGDPAASYVLGLDKERVYVAGKDVVRAYQTRGGKMLWSTKLDAESHGQGVLTPDGIYLPMATSITKVDLATGQLLGSTPVNSNAAEPVGNLFTDGKRLYALGLKKLIALSNGAEQSPRAASDPFAPGDKPSDPPKP